MYSINSWAGKADNINVTCDIGMPKDSMLIEGYIKGINGSRNRLILLNS